VSEYRAPASSGRRQWRHRHARPPGSDSLRRALMRFAGRRGAITQLIPTDIGAGAPEIG